MPVKNVLADFIFKRSPYCRDLQKTVSSLSESRQDSSSLLDRVQIMVVVFNRRLQPVFINEFALHKLGIPADADISRLRLLKIADREVVSRIEEGLREKSEINNLETELKLPGGEKIDADISVATLFHRDGRIKGYVSLVVDTSKRRRAEENLRNQIQFSQQIFQAVPEMIVVVDRQMKITYLNKKVREIIPQGDIRIIGQSIIDILPSSSLQDGFDELVRNVIDQNKRVNQINIRNPFLERESYVDLIVEPLRGTGRTIGAIILLRDVSEWRNLTAQLRSLQGFLEKMLNASPFAVISIASSDYVMLWNSSAEKMFDTSFDSVFGRSIYEAVPLFEQFRDTVDEVRVLGKNVFLSEEKIPLPGRENLVANLTFYPVTGEENSVVVHVEDVSAVKQMESSLMQVQKMESLGFLTSGIIHDFNNVLSGILGYASLLENKIPNESGLRKYVKTLMSSAERATAIANQMLNFSRKKTSEKEIVDVNDTIVELLSFLKANLRNIDVRLELSPDKVYVQSDRSKISQIIINLIVNARDALQDSDDPFILVRTGKCKIEQHATLLAGEYVQVEIEDNGTGIGQETLARIFEPFFTTKKEGKGTGLGLAILKDLLRDLGGDVEVFSEVGRGTLFRLFVPAFSKAGPKSQKSGRGVAAGGFSGTVLVVDDEEVVREIAVDMLATLGISALTATDGQEGLDVFQANIGKIDLVILDIEMPALSGEKVFAHMRAIDPEIKILVASGYSKEYLEKTVFRSKIEHFMAKPFQLEQLAFQLKKLLKENLV